MTNRRYDEAQKLLVKKALYDFGGAILLGVVGFVSVMALGLIVSGGIIVVMPLIGPWFTLLFLLVLVVVLVYSGLAVMSRLEAKR